MQAKRQQMQQWAADNLPRIYNHGYRTALADGEAKEIRQWAELMSRLAGAFPEKQVNPQAGLAVFQFNFGDTGGSHIKAVPVATPEQEAEDVEFNETIRAEPPPAAFQVRFAAMPDISSLLQGDDSPEFDAYDPNAEADIDD